MTVGIYVLIVVNSLAGYGGLEVPVTFQEFESYGSCQAGASIINTVAEKEIAFCTKK